MFAKKAGGVNRRACPPVHDDLVARRFTTDAPNMVRLTAITEHATGEGTLRRRSFFALMANRAR